MFIQNLNLNLRTDTEIFVQVVVEMYFLNPGLLGLSGFESKNKLSSFK